MTNQDIKQKLKDKLKDCDKEILIDIIAEVCSIYVNAKVFSDMSSANCIQQCVNNIQTNYQEIDNFIIQRINDNLRTKKKNKINIAELLKDCPIGTKLYSPICGECYFDRLNMGTIICKKQNTQEITFTSEGYYMLPIFNDCECALFPSKENRDWSKFQRPFKDGDILCDSRAYKESPFTITEITDTSYKGGDRYEVLIEQQDNFELAPSKFDISILKPFDKVLVRDDNERCWNCELFDSYRRDMHYQFNGIAACYKQCIPYEGNEHLLGTINNCDDFYKTWE